MSALTSPSARCEIAVLVYRDVYGAIDRRCSFRARRKVGGRGVCNVHWRLLQAKRKELEWYT